MRRVTLFFCLIVANCLFIHSADAQSLTGAWYGRANAFGKENANNYLTELVIKQKGNVVEGILGYYFRDQYQSFFIRGEYIPNERLVVFKNIPVDYFGNSASFSVTCPMNLSLKLTVAATKQTLKGNFYSQKGYQNTCGDLPALFTLDPADFSQEEDLKRLANVKRIWKPKEEDLVITPQLINLKKDSIRNLMAKGAPVAPQVNQLMNSYKSRSKTIKGIIEVESDSVRVSLYDNGQIDGDSISLFFNDIPVLTRQPLSSQAVTLYIKLDPNLEYNEIGMFAENLGRIPPNTALMVVTDGKNSTEVYLSSSLSNNSVMRLKRKKK